MRSSDSDKANYLKHRQRTIARYEQNRRPDLLLRRLSHGVDRCLRALLLKHPLPKGAALCAVGGYGRQELYPESDIDLLIVLQHQPDALDAQRVEQLLAAMWDAGLKPAHAVRTVEQCLEEADADISTQTSLLEARWVAGVKATAFELRNRLYANLDPKAFYVAKRAEMRQRHQQYHDTPYALEPNCKESPGGLRDLQMLQWLAMAAGLGKSWKDIAESQLLTEAELRALERVSLAFMRLRVELHLLCGRAEDRLLFDIQPKLAEIYGFEATPDRLASEVFMQRYYWAARVVSQLNTILMLGLEERLFHADSVISTPIDNEFEIRNNRLALKSPQRLLQEPSLIFSTFLQWQRQPQLQGLSAQTLRALWHARRSIDDAFRQCPVNRSLFIQILQQPRGVTQALRLMTMLNILPRYLPVFRRIVGQMQHDLFHAYTVDQHTLMVIQNLNRFANAEFAIEHSLATQLATDFDNYWLLYVAALFHDIAKGRGGNHSELGAADAEVFCQDHQLSAEDTALIVKLVREHLSMSLVAQKRDISNPEVVAEFVKEIANLRHLNALYLLTVADIRGTSPTIWNSWKAKLLDDLYQLSRRALGEENFETSMVLAQRKSIAMSQLLQKGIPEADILNFWSILDVDYFLRHDSSDIVWHSSLLYGALLNPSPVIHSRPLGQGETRQILVYTVDRPELFMEICAFFDQYSLSIQDARIYTTQHGWALDSFVVLVPTALHNEAHFDRNLERQLLRFLETPRASKLPEAKEYIAANSSRARTFPVTPRFTLSPYQDGHIWRLNIVTADRKGLLFNLARVFAEHHIDLKSAKIMTLGERVEDSFLLHSEHLQDAAIMRQFKRQISNVL